MRGSDFEAFATTTGIFGIWVVELEPLVETLFGKINLGAIEKNQAFLVDDYLHASGFKNHVTFLYLVGKLYDISQTRAAGGLDTQPQTYALAPVTEEVLHACCRYLA